MALPSNVSFGTVTGAFLRGVADTGDAGRDPDGIPVADLTIKFTAGISPAVVRDTSASPPVTILIDPITATVNADGVLVGPDGQPGVNLIASTDPDIQPTGWTWTAAISSATFPSLTFSFALDPSATVDLATVIQVPANPGATLDAWLAAVTAAQSAAAAAAASAAAAAAGGGGSGGSSALQYSQGAPASTWTVAHTFGRLPNVAVFDTTGSQVVPDVHASTTSVSLIFATPLAGSAVLT